MGRGILGYGQKKNTAMVRNMSSYHRFYPLPFILSFTRYFILYQLFYLLPVVTIYLNQLIGEEESWQEL